MIQYSDMNAMTINRIILPNNKKKYSADSHSSCFLDSRWARG